MLSVDVATAVAGPATVKEMDGDVVKVCVAQALAETEAESDAIGVMESVSVVVPVPHAVGVDDQQSELVAEPVPPASDGESEAEALCESDGVLEPHAVAESDGEGVVDSVPDAHAVGVSDGEVLGESEPDAEPESVVEADGHVDGVDERQSVVLADALAAPLADGVDESDGRAAV